MPPFIPQILTEAPLCAKHPSSHVGPIGKNNLKTTAPVQPTCWSQVDWSSLECSSPGCLGGGGRGGLCSFSVFSPPHSQALGCCSFLSQVDDATIHTTPWVAITAPSTFYFPCVLVHLLPEQGQSTALDHPSPSLIVPLSLLRPAQRCPVLLLPLPPSRPGYAFLQQPPS